MPQLSWYLKRLSVMGPREIFHRLQEQLTLLQLYRRYRSPRQTTFDSSKFRFCTAGKSMLPELRFDMDELEKAKPTLLKGRVQTYEFEWQWEDTPDVWHLAPDTGRRWPRGFFGAIRYRDGNPVGDVRKLWEPSRLQHLVDLAMICDDATQEEQHLALQMISAQLESWVRENPPMAGPHYISAMECALRLVAVCHALDLVRDRITAKRTWDALVAMTASHAALIEKRLSLHSSAGNHLLSEGVGLIYAGILFPELEGAERWWSNGLGILESESERQVLPDGGGIEQAFGYHRYNIQLLWLSSELLARHRKPIPGSLNAALSRGRNFLQAIAPSGDRFPFIGDSDSGFALSKYHLLPDSVHADVNPLRTFEASGYTVAEVGTSRPFRMIVDHGPLGMPPGYGHGHADALSVLLNSGEEDILADAGTYTYTGDQRWRRYFRGTPAHNTVTIDGKDQARQDGCFLWSQPYQSCLIASETTSNGGRLLATHTGYDKLGCSHSRGVAWQQDEWLLVWDCLDGEGEHLLELHWHLGVSPARTDGGAFNLPTGAGDLALELVGGKVSEHYGEEQPILGWYSPHYGARRPITTIKQSWRGSLPHEFRTMLWLRPGTAQGATIEDAVEWMRSRVQLQANSRKAR